MTPKRAIIAGLFLCAFSGAAGLYTAGWMLGHPSFSQPLSGFSLISRSEATVPVESFDEQTPSPVVGLADLEPVISEHEPTPSLAIPDVTDIERGTLAALTPVEMPVVEEGESLLDGSASLDDVIAPAPRAAEPPSWLQPVRKPDIAKILGSRAPVAVTFQQNVVHRAALARRTTDCMALAVYWEAQSEGELGMRAVAHVIQNRVANGRFPNSVCGVVRQSNARGCQFSWWCDGRSDKPVTKRAWITAVGIARAVLNGSDSEDPTEGAIFFNGTWQDTPWTRDRVQTVSIGSHAFFR